MNKIAIIFIYASFIRCAIGIRQSTRAIHARKGLALPSNLTDAEWALLEPLLPAALPGGRPRKWPTRRLVEAMLYMLRGGLPSRMLPPGFPR